MKISKINTRFFALLLGFAMVFGFSAFKSTGKRVNMVRYQFQNATDTNIDQVTSWDNVTSEEPEECSIGSTLPCIIEFDTDGTYPNLAAYLATNNTAALINASPEVVEKKASL